MREAERMQVSAEDWRSGCGAHAFPEILASDW